MKRTWILGATVALLALPIGQLAAQRGRGRGEKARAEAKHAESHRVIVDADIRIIHGYYRTEKIRLKPLPPGIAKNLARGKPLPPGIARKRLPARLAARLPERTGVHWVLAGDIVVALGKNNLVLDFVHLAY